MLRQIFATPGWRNAMERVKEVDSVLQFVRRIAKSFRFSAESEIVQQILLLGDSFYGYRFAASEYTAVWSAADRTVKMFDSDGQQLGSFCPDLSLNSENVRILPMPSRKAA
jgi:predicted secreted protein